MLHSSFLSLVYQLEAKSLEVDYTLEMVELHDERSLGPLINLLLINRIPSVNTSLFTEMILCVSLSWDKMFPSKENVSYYCIPSG